MARVGRTMRIVLYNNAETRRRETYANAIWKDATPKAHPATPVRLSVSPVKRSTWWQEYRDKGSVSVIGLVTTHSWSQSLRIDEGDE